jgi:leader peptidase (prepilin peptidase)/N-methyltransferase
MSIILSASIPEVFITSSYLTAFVIGAIIGSFLNVYIYRFHTGKSLGGTSHCLSCGVTLRWYELTPMVSYLLIAGRCRHCQSRVPIRYFLVELVTAILFTLTLTLTTVYAEIFILWLIMAVLVVIVTYDFYHFIIPDSLTATLTGLIFLWFGYQYWLFSIPLESMFVDVLSALIGAGFFLFLWFISKGAWLGFGDVKLAFPLGLLVGATSVFSFIVISFWVGAIVSLLLLAIQYLRRGKSHLRLFAPSITMKTAVPFAPFLIAGALIVLFTHVNVLSLFYFAM